MIFGIDVSSHQPTVDWATVKRAGFDFAFIKASGGDHYVNPYRLAQAADAARAGLVVGFYHYDGEPTVSTGTPEREAENFLSALPSPLPAEAMLALDAEEVATRDPARYRKFLDIVEARTGRVPFLYTYPNFVREAAGPPWDPLARNPLWFASYPSGNFDAHTLPTPNAPAPWGRVTIWQYSGGMAIPGVPGATDANRFDGTLDELRAYARPQPTGGALAGDPTTDLQRAYDAAYSGSEGVLPGLPQYRGGLMQHISPDQMADVQAIAPGLPAQAQFLVCEKCVFWCGPQGGKVDAFHRGQFERIDALSVVVHY